MVKRSPVSDIKNIWFDSEQVDDADLTQEQKYNDTINGSIISNHVGQGVLVESLDKRVIFDSILYSGLLDGTNILPQNQPSDSNFGNQLEVELLESKASGKRNIKVCIIGLDFEGNLQYERFIFKTNEKIVGKKHFTQILLLLFNDLLGPPNQSFNLGGRVLIREVQPFTLSRDSIMVAQDVQPNIFFRDFFTTTSLDVNTLLVQSLPNYNINNLNINQYESGNKVLLKDDVISHVGQKFLATTNNIQKISLLLAVKNSDPSNPTDLQWTGDLIVSIFPLQTSINCPTDISPNLQIDFSPSNIPIAQISCNYSSLLDQGIVLDSVPQPIDFVFSNTQVAFGNAIQPGTYYAITVKRAGIADKCDILFSNGINQLSDGRITLFSGTVWTDIPEEDLWFQVWTDSAKISSGQAYENGNGIIIPKTKIGDTGTTIDYSYDHVSFVGNNIFTGVISSVVEKSVSVQDQRTGNPIMSRQQYVPELSMLTSSQLSDLQNVGEPFTVGIIADKNSKIFDYINTTINASLHTYMIVGDEICIAVVTDPSDSRYDTNVLNLKTYLLNGSLTGAKIIPNSNDTSKFYRIASAQLCSMLYGDVNNDGIVDEKDLSLIKSLVGLDLRSAPPVNSLITTNTITTTFINGYTTLTKPFATSFSLSYQLVNNTTNEVALSGLDGTLVVNPSDPSSAQFTSISKVFNNIVGLGNYNLVILNGPQENIGGFSIKAIDSVNDVLTIKKIILNSEVFLQAMRADLNSDAKVSVEDVDILTNYIERITLQTNFTYNGPGTNPYTNIGKSFDVIKLRLEKFVDRTDEYTSNLVNRNNLVHTIQDIFIDGYSFFASHNFYSDPIPVVINKQFVWEEKFVITDSKAKLVPSVFTTQTGFEPSKCNLLTRNCKTYPEPIMFDSGRIDLFAPNNIIIGEGGELQRPDGYFYKVDFELGTIILELPDGLIGDERTINLMDDFISNYNNTGITKAGFPAMRFADCSFVEFDALEKDQVRFSVAVQSFSPNTDNLNVDGYDGLKMGVSVDYKTGLLTVNFKNLKEGTLPTLNTKIQVNVFLKKGGFNNQELFVDSTKLNNMLNLISVFSGSNVGGASAVVDLETGDVTGVLPIIHGGTGLNDVGVNGTVLVSNGTSLSYDFIYNLPTFISFSSGPSDENKIPKLDGYGLLDTTFYYKNPIYIYGVAGVFTNSITSSLTIGALTFRFDSFILQGIESIKLEAIVNTDNALSASTIELYRGATLITSMQTTSTSYTLLRSSDIKSDLSSGATDFVYEIKLKSGIIGSIASCSMARLVITYDNPPSSPPSYNFQTSLP